MVDRPICTISKLKQPFTQKLYVCNTCNFDATEAICEGCALFCHSGHNTTLLGYVYGYCACGYGSKACHCFLQNRVIGDEDFEPNENRQCTFTTTGTHYIAQDICICRTCNMSGNLCLCIPCSKMCHKNHQLTHHHHANESYCDCQQAEGLNCLISPPDTIPHSIPLCSFLLTKETFRLHNEMYSCTTCGMTEGQCICKSCAEVCHKGHHIVLMRETTGYCDCGSGALQNPCVLMNSIEPAG